MKTSWFNFKTFEFEQFDGGPTDHRLHEFLPQEDKVLRLYFRRIRENKPAVSAFEEAMKMYLASLGVHV